MGPFSISGAATTVTGTTRSIWQAVKTYMGTKSHNPLFMISSNKGVFGYHLGHLVDSPELITDAAESLIELYKQEKIKPVIDSVWAFEDVCSIIV